MVSLGPQGALGVDATGSVQVVPPPMKSQSTVGAGDSMVGAMTLRLAEHASLEDMVRFGVAAGSAATINHGTRLCSLTNTQKNLRLPLWPLVSTPFTRVKGVNSLPWSMLEIPCITTE